MNLSERSKSDTVNTYLLTYRREGRLHTDVIPTLPPRLNCAARRFERRAGLRALLVKEARAQAELAEEQLEQDVRTDAPSAASSRGDSQGRITEARTPKIRDYRLYGYGTYEYYIHSRFIVQYHTMLEILRLLHLSSYPATSCPSNC